MIYGYSNHRNGYCNKQFFPCISNSECTEFYVLFFTVFLNVPTFRGPFVIHILGKYQLFSTNNRGYDDV